MSTIYSLAVGGGGLSSWKSWKNSWNMKGSKSQKNQYVENITRSDLLFPQKLVISLWEVNKRYLCWIGHWRNSTYTRPSPGYNTFPCLLSLTRTHIWWIFLLNEFKFTSTFEVMWCINLWVLPFERMKT